MKIIALTKSVLGLIACLATFAKAQESIRIEFYDENPKIRAHDVVYENGDIKLAAALLLPADGVIRAGAVTAQGSGNAATRENSWGGLVAQLFVENGVAVLLTDKRGTGDSGGDWKKADFDDLTSDVIAGMDYLAGRKDIGARARRIGLIGLSQGGFYVPLAANKRPDDVAFIVNIGASVTTVEEQVRHELSNTFRQDGISGDTLAAFVSVNETMFAFVRGEEGMWERYLAEVEALRKDTAGELVDKHFNTDPDSWVWDWAPRILPFDPMKYWRSVHAPTFIAYGGEDEHDNAPVSACVALLNTMIEERSTNPDFVVRVYDGASHGIQVRTPEQDGVIRIELDPRFREDIANWLAKLFD